MKIYAFEVRDDEREYFEELSEIPGIELELHPEGLTGGRDFKAGARMRSHCSRYVQLPQA